MAYPPISTLPTPPSRQDPTNFATEADAFLGALPTFGTQANSLGNYLDGVAVAVEANANAAAASATSAALEAAPWVSSASYIVGAVVYSPIDFLSYRAKTNHSSITTDPSLDTTNWVLISGYKEISSFGITATVAELNYVDGVTSNIQTQLNTKANSTSPTLSGATFNDGYTEEVFAVSGTTPALSPTNGSIQTWTLSGNSTPTAGTWAAGQSITLMVDDGSAFTITWSSVAVTWKTDGGVAPTLNTGGFTVIVLWKVGATIYGARVGDS